MTSSRENSPVDNATSEESGSSENDEETEKYDDISEKEQVFSASYPRVNVKENEGLNKEEVRDLTLGYDNEAKVLFFSTESNEKHLDVTWRGQLVRVSTEKGTHGRQTEDRSDAKRRNRGFVLDAASMNNSNLRAQDDREEIEGWVDNDGNFVSYDDVWIDKVARRRGGKK